MDSYGNYISGSYGLKYFKTILLEKKDQSSAYTPAICIEIHEKGYVGTSREIGDLQGIRLNIEGDRGALEAAIVKTSVNFTMVDTWDEQDTENIKHGNWQEFYTPDSTRFLVKLIAEEYNRQGDLVDSQSLWSGYITPDSWQEGLGYRESVTITARDNIGHLQDFEFDLTPDGDGLVKVRDIITAAMAKINLPMEFYINSTNEQDYALINASGVNLLDTLINASCFEGDDWFSVLEKVLDSLGLVLRFAGSNKVAVTLIQYLSHPVSLTSPRPADDIELTFLGSGIRRIDPPYRSIREDMKYDYDSPAELDRDSGLAIDSTIQNTFDYSVTGIEMPGGGSYTESGQEPGFHNNGGVSTGWRPGTAFLDPSQYDIVSSAMHLEGEGMRDYVFLAANTTTDINASFRFKAISANMTFRMNLAQYPAGFLSSDPTKIGIRVGFRLYKIIYAFSCTRNGTTYYWNGARWDSSLTRLTKEYDAEAGSETEFSVDIHEDDNVSEGLFALILYRIEYKMEYGSVYKGVYARIYSMEVESNTPYVLDNVVTTINDETYNVRFNRKPEIGPLSLQSGVVVPGSYRNVLYYRPDSETFAIWGYEARRANEMRTTPFPVLVHMQILTNHISPMTVLEGDCAGPDITETRAYKYKGVRFLFISGTFNLLTQRIEGGVFRQFNEYGTIWYSSDTIPDYDEERIKGKTRNT